MIASLPAVRYGTVVTRLYAGRNVQSDPTLSAFSMDTGALARTAFPSVDASRRLFTIDFYDDVNRSFVQTLVNDTGISHKAAELSVVVKEIARITGSSSVIVVGHSLGGLAARAYVEGLASTTAGGAVSYAGEVPKIVTIDTPHKGANTSAFLLVPGLSQCQIETSPDKTELTPGSTFLTGLNARAIPGATNVSAIISWDRANGRAIGDLVVTGDQQSLATISTYTGASNVSDTTNEITGTYSPPVLHVAVHHLAQTITLVNQLITSFDGAAPGPAVPGTPSVLTAAAGATTLTLNWTPPGSGGSVSSYVIEAGSRPGATDVATVDSPGTGTTFSASNIPPGTYYVRVRAKNAAGLGAPSNEVTLTFGSSCQPVGAPTNLTAVANGSTVTLNWSAPSGATPTGYVLEAGSGPGLSNVVVSNLSNSTTLTSSGVTPGTYFIRIKSTNACGVSAASNEVTLTVR